MANYSDTAEHHVGMAVFGLSSSISNLWRQRLDPLTADLVLGSEGEILAALGSLKVLVEDIRASNDKRDSVIETLVAAE